MAYKYIELLTANILAISHTQNCHIEMTCNTSHCLNNLIFRKLSDSVHWLSYKHIEQQSIQLAQNGKINCNFEMTILFCLFCFILQSHQHRELVS